MSSSYDNFPPSNQAAQYHESSQSDHEELHSEQSLAASDGDGTGLEDPADHSDNSENPASSDDDSTSSGTETGDERPNRLRNTRLRRDRRDAAWRKHTLNERRIVASLDKLENQDLSAHLYNTFWLKKQNSERLSDGWQPRSTWTAWPLAPDVVPRLIDEQGHGPINPPLNSRQELAEILVATVTKAARERFLGRLGRKRKYPFESPVGNAESRVKKNDPSDSENWSGMDVKMEGVTDESAHSSDTGDEDIPLSKQIRRWRRRPSEQQQLPKAESPSSTDWPLARPSTDTDQASRILRPSISHTQAQFDKLLMALHRSRQVVRRPPTRDESPDSSSSASPEMSRIGSEDPSQSANLDHTESESSGSDTDSDQSPVPAPAVSEKFVKPEPKKKGRIRAQCRDWSDVLGMAMVTQAFPAAVLERARERCAELFEENMSHVVYN